MPPFPLHNAPFIWQRPVCGCHFYYQYYLCGCPDQTASDGTHTPSFRPCELRLAPQWQQDMHARYGWEHKANPPTSTEPSVLPFPCYRHLMESRVFLPPEKLREMRTRLMDPKWNPLSAARLNNNTHSLQRFQEDHMSQEYAKRLRDQDNDPTADEPPRKRYKPEPANVGQARRTLAALSLKQQATDLWALDGYRHRHPAPRPPREENGVRFPVYDGDTRGYHGGAYKMDLEMLRMARVANWAGMDPTGRRENELTQKPWFISIR
ncbi:hypothetical protein NEMBOFW57_010559 [Staphylotrichum longicolle]|uniref:Uncharacterized protein n=1 Tax=Staphylotrichum longicolle TaxID=669026 RepID=A0AAD4EN91_9PEZI|nr:hypothetical protein NEMBOFW57_010559 [Staphylotrichum longicolle]